MHRPYVTHYRVKKGDSLFRIALFNYGNGSAWPPIARFNHIHAPYRIVVGMLLRLPTLAEIGYHDTHAVHLRHRKWHPNNPGKPALSPAAGLTQGPVIPAVAAPNLPKATAQAAAPPDHFADTHANSLYGDVKARDVRFPALKFPLDKYLPEITMTNGAIVAKIKITGEITLQQEGTLTTLEISKDEAEKMTIKGPNGEAEFSGNSVTVSNITKTYKSKILDLGSETKIGWNRDTKQVTMSCKMTMQSKLNDKVLATSSFEVIPPAKLKYTYEPVPVEGKSGEFKFEGKMGFVIELTGSDNANPGAGRAWVYVGAGALVVGGVIIIGGDAIKDFFFLPASAESPLSWSAAMAMFARAGALMAPRTMQLAP